MPGFYYQHTRFVLGFGDQLLLQSNPNRVLLVISVFPAIGAVIHFGDFANPKLEHQLTNIPIPLQLRRVEIGPVICEPLRATGVLGANVYVTEGNCLNSPDGRLGC